MEIRINIVEVASELAHDTMVRDSFIDGIINDETEVYVSFNKADDDGEIIYTDVCQEIFDKYYDYYYDRLLKLKR